MTWYLSALNFRQHVNELQLDYVYLAPDQILTSDILREYPVLFLPFTVAASEPLVEKRVDACFYYHKREHDENVRLVQAGSLRLAPLLTHVLPLEQINQAMRIRSKQPDTSMKVVLECAE